MSLTFNFTGRRALVTGGAGALGKAIVKKFREAGAIVVIVDNDERSIEELLKEHPTGVEVHKVDLANWEETARALKKVGPVHHLVNNAGIAGVPVSFMEIQPQDVDRIMDINFKAMINVTQAVCEGMIEAKHKGTVVNVASIEFPEKSPLSISFLTQTFGALSNISIPPALLTFFLCEKYRLLSLRRSFLIARMYPKTEGNEAALRYLWHILPILSLPFLPDFPELFSELKMSSLAHRKVSLYSASKAAVSSLTKSMALELAPHNIRVNCISPAFMATNMTMPSAGSESGGVKGDSSTTAAVDTTKLTGMMKKFVGRQIVNRLLTTEETADLILYLSSSASSMVVGEDIIIDGGLSIN